MTVYLQHYIPRVAIAKVNYLLSEQKSNVSGVQQVTLYCTLKEEFLVHNL